jgi:hypothetical protein
VDDKVSYCSFSISCFLEEKKEAAMWHNMIVGCIGRSIITESYGNFRGIKLVNIDPCSGASFNQVKIK